MKKQIAILALVAGMTMSAHAGDVVRTEVVPATPGTYNFTNDPEQLVMRSYEITGVKPEFRANLVRGLEPLLANDGPGGTVMVSEQEIAGRKLIVLTITATEAMQASIPQTIAQINKGELGFYAPFLAIINYRPKYRAVKALAAVIKEELTPIGLVFIDEAINQITVEDDPNFAEYLKSVLELYDIPVPQLQVGLEVIESKSDVARDLGVWWEAWQRALPNDVAVNLTGAGEMADFQILSWEAVLKGASPEVLSSFLNYLETQGMVKITSRTTLHAFNAQPAEFRAGVDVPYRVVRQDGDGSVVKDEIAFEGLKLSVLASIGLEAQRLDVEATATSIVGLSSAGMPTMATSHVNTVIGFTGERTVLSGLKRTVARTNTIGLPLLSRVPVLKYFFSRERTTNEEWDVTILLSLGDDKESPTN